MALEWLRGLLFPAPASEPATDGAGSKRKAAAISDAPSRGTAGEGKAGRQARSSSAPSSSSAKNMPKAKAAGRSARAQSKAVSGKAKRSKSDLGVLVRST